MSVRSEREKSKMQEKYQLILSQMLKEDDNRFCVDCDTKSPRWASWNLGIFICIRCAGFHRNLGVHISKVKSVNLDSWTAEQIASMQAMGNNQARAVYEANLPPGFRRPTADSGLEAFIRSKYEQRKWLAKDWIPPEITVSSDLIESESNQRRNETASDLGQGEKPSNQNIPKLKPLGAPSASNNPVRQSANERSIPANPPSVPVISIPTPVPVIQPTPQLDLLGLDEPTLPLPSSSTGPSVPPAQAATSNIIDPLRELFTVSVTSSQEISATMTNVNKDLESAFASPTQATTSGPMSNDKIMALFKTPTSTGINLGPSTMVHTPGLIPPQVQQPHLHAHHKSASFGGNLYQQANNFPPRPPIPTQFQQVYPYPPQPGMSTLTHANAYAMSTPTLQSPASAFTHDQLNNQFSQFVPFANSKTNTSASALIAGMPPRPVTDYMPASSDLLWQ